MKRKRKKYSREFKVEAVRQMEDGTRKHTEIARALGISTSMLYRWQSQLKDDGVHAFPGQGNQTPEAAELSRLRAEVQQLRQERDILKKAVTFFAKESS